MAVVTPDLVYHAIRQHKLSLYKIKEGGNTIAMNDEKGLEEDDVISQIENTLEAVESGTVEISFYRMTTREKTEGGRVAPVMSFKVAVSKNAAPGTVAVAGTSSAELKTVLEDNYNLKLEIEKLKFENRLAELERKIEAAADKNDDGESIGSLLKPYAPMILQAMGIGKPAVTGIAGHEPVEVVTASVKEVPADAAAQNEKDWDTIDDAVEILWNIDSDFPQSITKLAAFATKYPDLFKTYLKQLPE